MRIVIDMQGAQTESRYRGIGRFTMAFAQAVVRNRGEHEILLALSGLFLDTIEPMRAAFDGLLPQENIRVWYAPGPVKDEDPNNTERRGVAELVREAFLASLCPDVVHVSSLFEGYEDDAVTSIGRFDDRTPVSVILYDLIPLQNPDQYLTPNPNFAAYYERKLRSLRNAKQYFAISGYTRQEGLDCLGVEADQIVNISTGIGSEFKPIEDDELGRDALARKVGFSQPFVLYSGGCDERKSLPRLIEAWSMLPIEIRETHHFLFAGRMSDGSVAEFQRLAQRQGLKDGELLFSGYVSDDELVQLYNLCKLFVFPSWHEGFGLPAAEAMACGAPVIGANTTSLPEVIGLEEALFDPLEVTAITSKLAQGLQDDAFRNRLREHGLHQARKFSWAETAKRALGAWEAMHHPRANKPQTVNKPRLAFVSPLPPERTGIADYSAELLPALAEHYEIELVVAQERVDVSWVNHHGKVRDAAWLRANPDQVERVLYQMGNSPFHAHMLPLMAEIPGVVVLHDFYIGHLMGWLELHGNTNLSWTKSLYETHGYDAVKLRYHDAEQTKQKYPVNGHVLQHARGIIVHSEYSRNQAKRWYSDGFGGEWSVIPLLRKQNPTADKVAARRQLGIGDRDFLVCSFGFLSPSKCNHRLLQAWLASHLADDDRCYLVFVGENHGGDYRATLLKTIRDSSKKNRIRITGFASPDQYKQYLAAADVAVQLRTSSQGETSAAVLDCMNHGLPVIVNAHGSMAELDPQAVWMLPDEFSNAELIEALQTLWRDPKLRRSLGERARQIIMEHHAPDECARRYAEAIEHFHCRSATGLSALLHAIAEQNDQALDDAALLQLSQAIATTVPLAQPAKRLFLDITATCRNDLKTGIERVARALTLALIESPPAGYRIEPVYLSQESGSWCHRHARRYTLGLLGCRVDVLEDEIVEPKTGDMLLALDLSGTLLSEAEQFGLFKEYRNRGVSVYATVFDLLPVQLPEMFPPGTDVSHAQWLRAISAFDGAICISAAVAADLKSWLEESGKDWQGRRCYQVGWWHLGADVSNSAPTKGLPTQAKKPLKQLNARPSFLMVGTVEPRKGYLQTIEAFTQLWKGGVDLNLVIVGREGWKDWVSEENRRDIPQIVSRLRSHPELNKRLYWLEGISDEYLGKVYAASTCLIAASYGEGFGLPLIEAAQHKLPIIARDILVFREVAGEHAFYFNANTPGELAEAITDWLERYQNKAHPSSDDMPWLTWKESAQKLARLIRESSSLNQQELSCSQREIPSITFAHNNSSDGCVK